MSYKWLLCACKKVRFSGMEHSWARKHSKNICWKTLYYQPFDMCVVSDWCKRIVAMFSYPITTLLCHHLYNIPQIWSKENEIQLSALTTSFERDILKNILILGTLIGDTKDMKGWITRCIELIQHKKKTQGKWTGNIKEIELLPRLSWWLKPYHKVPENWQYLEIIHIGVTMLWPKNLCWRFKKIATLAQ